MKKTTYRIKRSINLFYKPDRTTRPATIALYALFAFVCFIGLCKILIFDVWEETASARRTLEEAERQRGEVMLQLMDYNEVWERYCRYSATEEERTLVDRMEILILLDGAVAPTASMNFISIGGDTVQLQFSGVTLAETAQIVRTLESSPIVASTRVNTASTTEGAGALVQASVLIQLQKEGSGE